MSNDKYLLRLSCQIIPFKTNEIRVIIRTYAVTSPGTPAERINEISREARSQQTYYKLLDDMKAELANVTADDSKTSANTDELKK